jgi:hypothetical protein
MRGCNVCIKILTKHYADDQSRRIKWVENGARTGICLRNLKAVNSLNYKNSCNLARHKFLELPEDDKEMSRM